MHDTTYLQKIFQAIPFPVVVLSLNEPDFSVVFANKAYVNSTGVLESKLIGESIFKFFPLQTEFGEHLTPATLRKSIKDLVRIYTESGSIPPAAAAGIDLPDSETGYSVEPVLDDQNKMTGIVLCFEKTDRIKKITNNQASIRSWEKVTGESLEMNLFMNAPAFICILKGPEHIFRMANQEYEKITGRKDLIGKKVREVLPELEGQGYLEMLDKVYRTGESFKGNETHIKLDRNGSGKLTDCYIDFSYQAYRNAKDYIEGVFVLGTDVTYQVEARKAVQEAEQMNGFKAELLNSVGEAVLSTDRDGRINFWNKAAEKIYGWTSSEALGKDLVELLASAKKESEGKEIMQNLSAGISWSGEFTIQDKSGREFPVYIHSTPNYTDEGVFSGIISVSYDNTQRKKEIEELKYANSRMRLATRTAGMGIWDWNIQSSEVAWDIDMHRIYHDNKMPVTIDPKDLWTSVIHPDDRERVHEELRRAASGEEDYNSEYRVVWPDATVHFVRASGMIEKDDQGHPVRMIGVNWDITSQKEKEQQLKLMGSVVTNTNDSVLITEAEPACGEGRRIVYVNNAFTRMTGYSSEHVISKTPALLQGPKTDITELKNMEVALSTWQCYETTVINYKKNGEEFWNNFSLTPVADETGWFTHWISIERDVTLRKNEELERGLLAEISVLFNSPVSLKQTLANILERVAEFADFGLAEAWLVSADLKTIHLVSNLSRTKPMQTFYTETAHLKRFRSGEGLPGITWEKKNTQVWSLAENPNHFIRAHAAKKAGLQTIIGVPLIYNNEIIGVFLFGKYTKESAEYLSSFLELLGKQTGIETRRKQLEQELNQIFSSAPDIICIIGWDGFFKKINPAACDLLEYTEMELMAIPTIQFVHPEDQQETRRVFANVRGGNLNYYLENRCIGKSGKIKWLAWTGTYSPDEGLLFAVAKDITEKKELENLLKKANSLARIGSWEVDMVNNSLYWSDVTREIHETDADFTPDVETAVNFYKEGKNRELIVEHMTGTIKNGKAFDTELQIVTARGKEKWIRVIGDSESVDGKVVRLYGSFQDIDKRKRDELAVNRILEEKNIILESIGDGFFAIDKDWNVTYWNNQAEDMLNIRKTEILGRNVWQELNAHLRPVTYARYMKDIEQGKTVHFETYLNSVYKWFFISVYPSDQGLSVYFRDITENKISEMNMANLNANIQKHAKDLAISNAELEQFAYVASHDLQEPLRMITSYLTQIDKKYGEAFDEKGKKYMFFAVDGAKRMRQIILDLLEYSRVGRSGDKAEFVDLNEIISEIRILFRKQIEDKKAVIISENLPTVRSVISPVRQVLQNLIGNALKYTSEGISPEIHVSCKETGTYWEFAIKDNGIGIEKEFYEKIFIIFQRLHTREQFSGTGLGLAITRKIIDHLGGSIWVESVEGQGSIFYFTLKKNME